MIEQKPLSLALRITYFASSLLFAILMPTTLSVVYLGALSNSAVNRIDVGSFVVGILFICALLVAVCWISYLPLRRHPGLIRIATAAFALVVVMFIVLMAVIDWG